MPILPASFIRGSALWRDVAALFNPRCSHDDLSSRAVATAFASLFLMGSAFAQTPAPATPPPRRPKPPAVHAPPRWNAPRRPTPRDCTARSARNSAPSARRPRLTSRSDFVLPSFSLPPCGEAVYGLVVRDARHRRTPHHEELDLILRSALARVSKDEATVLENAQGRPAVLAIPHAASAAINSEISTL